jgi:hypothetical protein
VVAQDLARRLLTEPDHRGVAKMLSQLAELKQSDSDFPNIEMDCHKEFWDAIRLAHGRKSQLPKSREIGSLTVKSDVQPALLGCIGDLDRCHPVDQPEHAVGKGESPDRRDGEGDELLQKEAAVAGD